MTLYHTNLMVHNYLFQPLKVHKEEFPCPVQKS